MEQSPNDNNTLENSIKRRKHHDVWSAANFVTHESASSYRRLRNLESCKPLFLTP